MNKVHALENHRTPSGQHIHPEGIHRDTNGPSPSCYTSLRLRTLPQEKALRTHISIDEKQYRIRKFIQSGILQSTKCLPIYGKGATNLKMCMLFWTKLCGRGMQNKLRKCANCRRGSIMKTCPEHIKRI